jgi:hypothetical protein
MKTKNAMSGEVRPDTDPLQQPALRPITRQEQAALSNLLCKKCRRGPLKLEADLLIQRIKQRDGSGYYLATAFLSAYRNLPFTESLFYLVNLDAEALRLFQQIIYMRHIPNWDDNVLYSLERQIISIVKGE